MLVPIRKSVLNVFHRRVGVPANVVQGLVMSLSHTTSGQLASRLLGLRAVRRQQRTLFAETAFCTHIPTDLMEEEDELSLAQPVTNRVLWIDCDKEETEDSAVERIKR